MGTREQATVSGRGQARTIDSGERERWRSRPAMPDTELDLYDREEWQLAVRVAASKVMAKSELLPRFLLHICEISLRGRGEEMTEQRVGMLIFNRPAGYNPGEDNIVRSYARTLRKRLDEYFANEGRDERLRISIPRGGYIAIFEPAESAKILPHGPKYSPQVESPDPLRLVEAPADVAPAAAPAPTEPTSRRHWFFALGGLLAGVLLAGIAWMSLGGARKRTELSAAHPLWAQLFQPNRATIIIPADSGLGILENLSKRSITVEQYANGSYLNELATGSVDPANFADIGRQRYTSVVDLNVVARLSRLPEYTPERTTIRYVRGVTAEDIKNSNAVLIGSKHTNPWVSLFERSMNFSFDYTPTVDESFIINRAPAKGEQAVYRNAPAGGSGPTYGVIAYLPSLNGSGHVLIVEGLNMASTEAAAEVLFYDKLIQPALKQAKQADGTLRPFELLVETSSVGATSPEARILATRIHEN